MGPKAVLRHLATTADAYDVLRLHSAGHPVKFHDAPHKWGEPSKKKIGPFGQRSVSIFSVYSIELVAKKM